MGGPGGGELHARVSPNARRTLAAIDKLAVRGHADIAARVYDGHLELEMRDAVRAGWERPEMAGQHPDADKVDALVFKLHQAEAEIAVMPSEHLVSFSTAGQVLEYQVGGDHGVDIHGARAVRGAVVTRSKPRGGDTASDVPDADLTLSDVRAVFATFPNELRTVSGSWVYSWKTTPQTDRHTSAELEINHRDLRKREVEWEVKAKPDEASRAMVHGQMLQELARSLDCTYTRVIRQPAASVA